MFKLPFLGELCRRGVDNIYIKGLDDTKRLLLRVHKVKLIKIFFETLQKM